jgi:hypothetical protein
MAVCACGCGRRLGWYAAKESRSAVFQVRILDELRYLQTLDGPHQRHHEVRALQANGGGWAVPLPQVIREGEELSSDRLQQAHNRSVRKGYGQTTHFKWIDKTTPYSKLLKQLDPEWYRQHGVRKYVERVP